MIVNGTYCSVCVIHAWGQLFLGILSVPFLIKQLPYKKHENMHFNPFAEAIIAVPKT